MMIKDKSDSLYSKSDLFIIFYVSAYFLNESESWTNIYSSSFSLFLLVLCLLLSKYRGVVFIFFLLISTYFIFEKYPRVSNHSTLIMFINIYLFVSLLIKKVFYKEKLIIKNNDFLFLRWSLIIAYFFTGFHKLNYDFLFSENSCANWYHTKLFFNLTNQVIKPYPDIIYIISPFLVVILELTESIGLLFRRTQLIGLYSFILLHFYLVKLHLTKPSLLCYLFHKLNYSELCQDLFLFLRQKKLLICLRFVKYLRSLIILYQEFLRDSKK